MFLGGDPKLLHGDWMKLLGFLKRLERSLLNFVWVWIHKLLNELIFVAQFDNFFVPALCYIFKKYYTKNIRTMKSRFEKNNHPNLNDIKFSLTYEHDFKSLYQLSNRFRTISPQQQCTFFPINPNVLVGLTQQ